METSVMSSLTHQVGEEVVLGKTRVIVEEATDQCEGCYLFDQCLKADIDINCVASRRPDGIDVIYKKKADA